MTAITWRLLLLICVGVTNAAAQEHCLQPEMLWSCVGVVEISSTKAGTLERRRMTQFVSGEVLAEVERKGVLSRALILKPSGLTLYQGIDDLQSANSTQSPFMFFNEAVGWGAFLPLQTAYPSGPDSVPEGSAEKVIEIDNIRFNLQTTRIARDQIKFRYETAKAGASVEGAWDRNQPEPWSNEASTLDWKHSGPQTVRNLGEARSVGKGR